MSPSRQSSIAKRLTVALVSGLLLAACLALAVNYYFSAAKGGRELERKADEYLEVLTKSLKRPLWHYDADTIRLTGKTFAQNELVTMLKVTDSAGQVIFNLQKPAPAEQLLRQADIEYKNQMAGHIQLGLSTLPLKRNLRDLLFYSILLVCFLSLTILLAAGLLLRTFLKKPLQQLSDLARACGAGDYPGVVQAPSALEFQPVVKVMRKMSDEIQRQMEGLQQAEERYRSIVENSMNGIFQSTPEGRYLAVNPAYAQMMGYGDPEEVIGQIEDIGGQLYADPDERRRFVEILTSQGAVSDYECRARRKDGRVIWVSQDARCVRDQQGRLLFFEGFVINITKRKLAEQALLESHERLEERVRERTAELERGPGRSEDLERTFAHLRQLQKKSATTRGIGTKSRST